MATADPDGRADGTSECAGVEVKDSDPIRVTWKVKRTTEVEGEVIVPRSHIAEGIGKAIESIAGYLLPATTDKDQSNGEQVQADR